MRGLTRSLLFRVLFPIIGVILLTTGATYLLMERLVIAEIRERAEGVLQQEAQRVLGRLRGDFSLLFHAFGDDPDRFGKMSELAKQESLGYIRQHLGAQEQGVRFFLLEGGRLLLPEDPAPKALNRLEMIQQGVAACRDCLSYRVEFVPWGWEIILYGHRGEMMGETDRTVTVLLLATGMMALLIVLVTVLVLRRQIDRPIERVLAHLDRVGRGVYDPLRLGGNREIGALARGITRMGDRIRSREAALKESEQRYCQLAATLEKRVEEEIAHRIEEQKLLIKNARFAGLGEMITALSHHWRQPLTAVSLLIQSLPDLLEDQKLDAKELDRVVRGVMKQVEEMSRTIDGLRGLTTGESRYCDSMLGEVQSVYGVLAAELLEEGIAVSAHCFSLPPGPLEACVFEPDGSGSVKIALADFRQVVFNLLTNARDAILMRRAEEGREVAGEIAIRIQRQGAHECLEVIDNGCGIDAETMEHLFEPFFTTKERGKGSGVISGSGLGLYAAKLAIEEVMGGTIEAHQETKGTRFVVCLPLVK